MRADKEVVLAAVATTPYSLKFASDDLRANKEVILTSIHYAKPNMSNHIRYALEQLGEKEFPTIIDIIIKQQQNIYKPNVSRHYKSHLAIGMVPKDFWAYESFVSNFSKAWHSNNFRDCFYSSYIDNGLITNNSFIIKLSKLNPYCVSNNKIINQENN